jgi:hypothetical protein
VQSTRESRCPKPEVYTLPPEGVQAYPRAISGKVDEWGLIFLNNKKYERNIQRDTNRNIRI